MVIHTERMRGIEVDPRARRVRIGAGVLSRDLLAAAGAHGLTFLAGCSPDAGVVGHTLRGGVGWLGRRFGLACNTVVGAQVITADGAIQQVDAEHEPELFWALRGGVGTFAAIASLELRLVPVREVHAGSLLWPVEQAAEVLHCWRVWNSEVPDTVASIARLQGHRSPTDVDARLGGRRHVGIETVIAESEQDADIWLRPLRALRPALDTIAPRHGNGLDELHGDGARPSPPCSGQQLLHELTAGTVDALLERASPDVASPALVDVFQLGGALGRSAPHHGALDRIDAGYALRGLSLRRNARPPQRPGATASHLDEQALRRLQAVKATHDPENRFVSLAPCAREPLP